MQSEDKVSDSAKPSSPPLSRKDLLSIGISTLALSVSSATFVLGRIEKSREARKAKRRQDYDAFQLGFRFALALFSYTTNLGGEPDKIAASKRTALDVARGAQQYAKTLDFFVPLESLIEGYGASTVEEPYAAIALRIRGTVDSSTVDVFRLAFWLTGLEYRGTLSHSSGGDRVDAFQKVFAEKVTLVNSLAQAVGVAERLGASPKSVEHLKTEIGRVRDALLDSIIKRDA